MDVLVLNNNKIYNLDKKILSLSTYINDLYQELNLEINKNYDYIPLISTDEDTFNLFLIWFNQISKLTSTLPITLSFNPEDFIFLHQQNFPDYNVHELSLRQYVFIKYMTMDLNIFKQTNVENLLKLLRFGINNQIIILINQIAKVIYPRILKFRYENDKFYAITNNKEKYFVSITEALIIAKYMIRKDDIGLHFPKELLKNFKYNPLFLKRCEQFFSVENLIFESIDKVYKTDKNIILYSGSKCLEHKNNIVKIYRKHLSGSDLGRKLNLNLINLYIEKHIVECKNYIKSKVDLEEYENKFQQLQNDVDVCKTYNKLLDDYLTFDHVSNLIIHYYEYFRTPFLKNNFIIPNDVIEISKKCFENSLNISYINIPTNIEYINSFCFDNCKSLTAITLPTTIAVLPEGIFYNCSNLRSINQINGINYLPSSIKIIELKSFYRCEHLENLDISFVEAISSSIFDYCGLTALTIPNGIKRISEVNFTSSYKLKRLVIPGSIIENFKNKFINSNINIICNDKIKIDTLKSIKLDYNINLINKNNLISVATELETRSGTFDIPSYVNNIYDYCFYNCQNIKHINIPDNITNIQNGAFQNCIWLTSIRLPNLNKIPDNCFNGCYGLSHINIPNTVTQIGSEAFKKCINLRSLNIEHVKLFSKSCFENCSELLNLKLGNIKSIPNKFVKNCKNLRKINIPAGVLYVGDAAFNNCINLENIEYNYKNCISIGKYAFENCSKLSSIILPSNLKTINERCFLNCCELKNINCFDDNNNILINCLPNSTTEIGISAFECCSSITSLDIKNVSIVKNDCFISCSSLSELNYQNKNITFGNNVFEDCISLNHI